MVKTQDKTTSHFMAVSDPVLSISAKVRYSLANTAIGSQEVTEERGSSNEPGSAGTVKWGCWCSCLFKFSVLMKRWGDA